MDPQRLRHILIERSPEERPYTSVRSGRRRCRVPARDDRVGHADRLRRSIDQARDDLGDQVGREVHDIALEVVGATQALQLEKLERLRSGLGIELRSTRQEGDRLFATVFVPERRLEGFVRLFEAYAHEDTAGGRPKNEPLVAGIDEIRTPVLRSFWTDDPALFPPDDATPIWWEVWLQVRSTDGPDDAFVDFVAAVGESELRVGPNALEFKERQVFHVHGTVREWTQVFVPLLDRLAELRKAKKVASEFFQLDWQTQRELVDDLLGRVNAPPEAAPSVCILDYGIRREHPLIQPFLRAEDLHAIDPAWGVVDNRQPHGTEVAGLAVFGEELASLLANNDRPFTPHRLESARILSTNNGHPEETWGWVTQEGVALAEQRAPDRSRVILLTATANDRGRDNGFPSAWSAAIDQSAAGELDDVQRLYVVSTGNVWTVLADPEYRYPDDNIEEHRVEDPAQSWNAITVGACTDLIQIRDPELEGHTTLARRGELCPTSRTSVPWPSHEWPLKPDIVLEGGNYTRSPEGTIGGSDDLTLLTSSGELPGKLLTWMSDTSAAAAQAARMAAILRADYPDLWPETIRGLLIHSARWTNGMTQQAPDRGRRLRCFGWGRPDLDRARFTLGNRVSLIRQGVIQPFERVRVDGKWKTRTKEFHLHSLPWPAEALAALHEHPVTIRVTLSYFIEPSPRGGGWKRKFRYQSHGLRFKLRGPTETPEQFLQRVSKREWGDEEQGRPVTADPIDWTLGTTFQNRGSIHSDWWTTTGIELAECGQLAVHPVAGWWSERVHLGHVDDEARYSLIVTIETEGVETDLYTPIVEAIRPGVEIDVEQE